jgi:FKBP-type peptidyl-prolyl cis-trans isomerase FkpA/FKBP-type peptidyl-prolyl cis-trans isomerase FklB
MRTLLVSTFGLGLLIAGYATAQSVEPKTEDDKTLYALGVALAQNLGPFNLSPSELEMVKAGLSDSALHKPTKVDAKTYYPKLRELQSTRAAAAGKAVLDKAAGEKGATRTASGIVIVPIKQGAGPTPKATDTVKVNYHGTLPDGKVFDTTVGKDPVSFPLNGVIPCWTEGVQSIKVGGKSKLVCPSNLAYGDRGAPPDIGPGATLIFEVELLAIEKAPPAQPAPPQPK